MAIDRLSDHSPNACLNLKSEWGHSRTPELVNKESNKVRRKNELDKKGMRPREREKEGNEEEAQEEGRQNDRKRFRQDMEPAIKEEISKLLEKFTVLILKTGMVQDLNDPTLCTEAGQAVLSAFQGFFSVEQQVISATVDGTSSLGKEENTYKNCNSSTIHDCSTSVSLSPHIPGIDRIYE